MDRGYLKLWRKSLDSEVFASETLWRLWSWCLMKTTHKTRHTPLSTGRGQVVATIHPGQFVFGRNKAAAALGWVPSTLWKRMLRLEEIGCIKIESNNHYSVVSICNWEEYQCKDDNQVTTKWQPSDSQVATKEQPSDTDKNEKNEKNNKKKEKDTADSQNKFVTPSVDDVRAYCLERKNNIDPEYFVDKYTGNGWMVGKSKMKCWKATVRTWEKNNFGNGGSAGSKPQQKDTYNGFDQRDYQKHATKDNDIPEFLR